MPLADREDRIEQLKKDLNLSDTQTVTVGAGEYISFLVEERNDIYPEPCAYFFMYKEYTGK